MAWLDDHPPSRSQFRCPRRATPSGVIVVHTAENVMDLVGPDTGAESVANFIRTRDTPGSYHELIDSDSYLNLVRWTCEAFHDGTGSNPHSFGLSFACRTEDWARMSTTRRDRFISRGVERAVAYARWCRSEHGIIIPATRITREESDRGVPGFISHAQRDPRRRTDPGQDFPWPEFLSRFRVAMHPPAPTPAPSPPSNIGDLMAPFFLSASDSAKVFLVEEDRYTHIKKSTDIPELAKSLGIPAHVAEVDPDTHRALVDGRSLHT